MNEGNDNENVCPICCELLDNNCVSFKGCNHMFCGTCTRQILFKHKVICPLDRKKLKTIYSFTQDRIKIQQSIRSFQIDLWLQNRPVVHHTIETLCFNSLVQSIRIVNLMCRGLRETKEKYRSLCDSVFPVNKKLVDKINIGIENINTQIKECENKIPLQFHTLPNIRSKLFHYVVINDYHYFNSNVMKQLLFIMVFMINTNLKIHRCSYRTTKTVAKKKLISLTDDLKKMNKIRRHLTGLVISHVDNNRDLYTHLHPHNDGVDLNKCVICTRAMKLNTFVEFTGCHHKICCKCVNRCQTLHASCPFDSMKINHLEIVDFTKEEELKSKSLQSHLKKNIEATLVKVCNRIVDSVVPLIEEIAQCEANIAALIPKLGEFRAHVNLGNANTDEMNHSMKVIKSIFQTFPVGAFLSNVTISIVYNSSLMCFVSSFGNIHSETSFDELFMAYHDKNVEQFMKIQLLYESFQKLMNFFLVDIEPTDVNLAAELSKQLRFYIQNICNHLILDHPIIECEKFNKLKQAIKKLDFLVDVFYA